jgi:orotidine-5'-phosphate decarboxylase
LEYLLSTQLIIALDVDAQRDALEAVDACQGCNWFKVGLQLFSRTGPSIVDDLTRRGKRVFLDLKLHDIPTTVSKAAKAAADLGAGMITVHAAGGTAMIRAARTAVEGSQTRILAVTVLTSINDEILRSEVGLNESAVDAVVRYAKQSVAAGAHGLVSSPLEVTAIRDVVGPQPILVTPGVRPAWSSADDQARFVTPKEAAEAGSSYIVVGRPILKHARPSEAVRLVLEELSA